MMADLFDAARPAAGEPFAWARARSRSASVRPAPKAPIFRKLRRLMPSQNFCLPPQMVSMDSPLAGTKHQGDCRYTRSYPNAQFGGNGFFQLAGPAPLSETRPSGSGGAPARSHSRL